MYQRLKKLFPLCRSITGEGVRETFRRIREEIPLDIQEIPSGTPCFDWVVPDEWNVEGATLAAPDGKTVADFRTNNLHLLNYSEPFSGTLSLEALRPHLFSVPGDPDAIPYLTTYYRRNWGFCLPHRTLESLPEGDYRVEIRATLSPGSLSLAEAFLPGESKKEIFFSSYVCHPSMANDSLSGVTLAVELYRHLAQRTMRRYSYRFIFVPETIGAIAYLSRNKERIRRDAWAGMILTCCGDPGPFNYKRTRNGHTLDSIVENVLRHGGFEHRIHDFWLPGSDERQYSSPGINLPVGTLMRSIYGRFPEYHTSKDNLDFVTEQALNETFLLHARVIDAIEGNRFCRNLKPDCEPFLSRYGLYDLIGGQKSKEGQIFKMLSLLNYSDGTRSLLEIADRIGVSVLDLIDLAAVLEERGLLASEKTEA